MIGTRRTVAIYTAIAAGTILLGAPPAGGEPQGCPAGAIVDDKGCSAILSALSADSTNGTLTGTPVGGTTPITIFGKPQFYLPSTGFGASPPDAVQQWDSTIQRVGSADPADPNWYGRGKAAAFLPRQLNELATHLPGNTLVIRFAPDGGDSHIFTLASIQPVG